MSEQTPFPTVLILRETNRAYYAGLVDADGTICFVTQERMRFNWETPRLEIQPFVGIYDKKKSFVDDIKVDLGFGKVAYSTKGYYWSARKIADVLLMCKLIEPYLRLKQTQCKLMIEYCESKLCTKKEWRKPWHKPYTKRQLHIVQTVTLLNRSD